jgi:hypothetical protein
MSNEKITQYISTERIQILQDAIGLLNDLTPKENVEENVEVVVGTSIKIEDRDLVKTSALQELTQVNKRRAELINILMSE